MNKTALQQQIIATLEADREVAKAVLAATHEAATHAESKAENKYDTRGLEAAYLADGQRRRLHEIETALAAYRNLHPTIGSDEYVRVGALLFPGARWRRTLVLPRPGCGGAEAAA